MRALTVCFVVLFASLVPAPAHAEAALDDVAKAAAAAVWGITTNPFRAGVDARTREAPDRGCSCQQAAAGGPFKWREALSLLGAFVGLFAFFVRGARHVKRKRLYKRDKELRSDRHGK